MPVLLVIVGLVVLAVAVYVAMGRGGELSHERADYAPLDLGPVSATDVALLRPPSNGWGYNKEATDEALGRIAESVRERDVRIVALEQLVTDLSRDPAPVALGEPIPGARHRRAVETAEEPHALEGAQMPGAQMPETGAPEAETSVPYAARGDNPAETTLPQPVVPSAPRVWPTTPGLPSVSWPTAPARSDAAAEETTAPQPAISEPIDEPADGPAAEPAEAETNAEAEAAPPHQEVRERGGQPERQPHQPDESRQQEPPPERSHG